MTSQPSSDEAQFRALIEEMIRPDDPRLKAAVVEVLEGCLPGVFAHISSELEDAGHCEAAAFVRRNFGS